MRFFSLLGSRASNGASDKVIADINVTPMVDVMLVLLIIFMVAAPLMHSHIKVDLPTGGQTSRHLKKDATVLTLNADKTLFLGSDVLETDALQETLKKVHPDAQQPIYLKADKVLSYGYVVDFMDTVHRQGYRLALITEVKPRGR